MKSNSKTNEKKRSISKLSTHSLNSKQAFELILLVGKMEKLSPKPLLYQQSSTSSPANAETTKKIFALSNAFMMASNLNLDSVPYVLATAVMLVPSKIIFKVQRTRKLPKPKQSKRTQSNKQGIG